MTKSIKIGLAFEPIVSAYDGEKFLNDRISTDFENAHTINFYIQFSGLEDGQRKKATKR